MKIKHNLLVAITFLTSGAMAKTINISSYGNAWVENSLPLSNQYITSNGIKDWTDQSIKFNHYFYANATGKYTLSLNIERPTTPTTLRITHNGHSKLINVTPNSATTLNVGQFEVTEKGYQTVEIQGVATQQNSTFPAITGLTLDGEAMTPAPNYVKEDFYWGRRGPSVHLNYPVPDNNKNYNWFYNEVTVPSGYDPQGSYFMANGFGEGYFGIQVNSATERRVLFSVWSPYHTDDPSTIPDNLKIKLLDKGEGVYVGQFGNEGSGGQSYLRYQWQPDTTYRFLVNIQPSTIHQGHTEYRGYFYAPEVGQWQLIAAFSRPETNTYVARPHSFLENFIPAAGQLERKAFYNRQFLRDTDGNWVELNKARFTYDATAAKGSRLDYQGGEAQGGFYLRNTGFFSGPTPYLSEFNRVNSNNAPVIPWQSLQAHP